MKYLLPVLVILVFATATKAQSFEWNSKSVPSNSKEVQPADGSLQAYEKAYNERQVGLAGIYNPNAHNSRTVYGETYNSAELTGSHGILPLGTLVQVVNLDNNRTVNVRINDRGQECSDCLIMLSQASADALGLNYRGRVTVERTGFSNWNPARVNSPVAYGTQPQVYGSISVPAQGGSVVRPVRVGGQAVGWEAKGGQAQPTNNPYDTYRAQTPSGYNQPTAYGQQTQVVPQGEVAVLGARSVMTREVDPAVRANQPTSYSRRPTVVPAQQSTYPAQRQPQTYQAPTQQPTYQQPSYQQPTYQQPNQVVPQAAPPRPTVSRYQAKGSNVTPESYGQRATTAPTAYAAVRTVPTPATTSAKSGYAVQLGAYNNELYAQNRVNQLKASGMSNVFYIAIKKADGQMINRVYAGTFTTMADAQVAATDIRNDYQIAGIVTSI
jgi:rare lipoprotein A (peptidoglycan hydrolase)